MSEHPEDEPAPLAIPHEPAEPVRPDAPAVETRRSISPVAWIALVLAVVEAGALAFVWTNPRLPPALEGRLASVENKVQSADARADGAATAAASATSRLDAMQAAIAGLQKRPAPPPPFDPHPLQAEVDALKSTLQQTRAAAASAVSLATATQKSAQSADVALSDKIEGVQSAQHALSDHLQAVQSGAGALAGQIGTVSGHLDALSARVEREGAQARDIASLASSAARLARLQAASVALSIGRPTGSIPNAPPALARFATEAPPTEASLILAFPDAAQATLRASEPDTEGQGFFRRLWVRAQSAVTVRDGSRVLVGDPAAGIVAAARERLAAGDLDGAVSVLGALSGAAADAMDPWRSRAASLVDARAALASMMAHQ